ncbi:ECF transporter S component [Bacillus sp. PS06]|uniref:ECF transporter S component n=1 Tax=Bacillus sp. PS06 TaxID=2764176 RepID=UPI00177FADA6|nr:ECF transporter S component [Bacillus sp. PS06]MBD8070295.1 ECF transporter S component [Bacillus sp. PS06]
MESRQIGIIFLILFPPLLLLLSFFFENEYFLLFGVALLLISMLIFFRSFEKKRMDAREIVLLATLAAIAAVSRIPFSMLPSVQPTTFIVIVSGIVFGAESGFLIGAVAAFVSNIILGQGPWTPWQMYSWGMIGLIAGLIRHTLVMKKKLGITLYGIITGFVYGWIMNLYFIVGFIKDVSWKEFIAFFAASFYFDLTHALSNAFFILIFGATWIKILTRFKLKYGLLSK